MPIRTSQQQRRGGCLPLAVACITACCLLVLNRIIVLSLYLLLVPEALDHPKVQSLITMIMIVGLLFPEWWVLDRLTHRLWRAPEERKRHAQ